MQKKITVQNVLPWKDVCFSQLKQKTAQCIQKLPHPLSVFPDLSQEHYYGIAVSSRKSIVGIEMQMSKPNSPLPRRGSLSPSFCPSLLNWGRLNLAMARHPRTLALQPERCLGTHDPGLCSFVRLISTHQLGSDEELYQHHQGTEDGRGFQSPHVAITSLSPQK